MRLRKAITTGILIALALSAAFAKGGGGLLVQRQMPSWNFSPLPASDASFQAWTIGGYGYGILGEGTILGGFGQLSWDLPAANSASSGTASSSKLYFDVFGGLLIGQSLGGDSGPRLNLACKLGLGYLERLVPGTDGEEGGLYVCGLVDPYLELSLPLARWLRLSAALGYQYVRAFDGIGADSSSPSVLSNSYIAGTPTLGVALTFGK